MKYAAIDADSHVGEPADLWTARFPGQETIVPHVRHNEAKDRDEWWISDRYVTLAPAGTVAGAPGITPPRNPKSYTEAHPAAFDRDLRLELMDQEGIWAEVLYPNVGGFGSDHFMKIEDIGLRTACVRAYNDYLTEWIGERSDRLVPVAMLPFWDIRETVLEAERCSKLGHKAVLMTGKPDVWWGWPHIADPYWTPLWEAASSLGLSISLHAGGGDPVQGWLKQGYRGLPDRTRYTANTVPTFFGNAQTLVDIIFGGVLERHPDLKWVTVESGIGWISFLLECMDYQFRENRVIETSPNLRLLPSEYFHRQFLATFWFERLAPARLLDHIGEDNVMFETDFPHPTSLWPPESVLEQAQTCMADQPESVRSKALWRNANTLYGIGAPTGTFAEGGAVLNRAMSN